VNCGTGGGGGAFIIWYGWAVGTCGGVNDGGATQGKWSCDDCELTALVKLD